MPLLPTLALLDSPLGRDAATALRRFSTVGHAAVAIVLLTGVANTVLILGRWPGDFASPYRTLLAAKITLVLLMTGLAVLNRYGFVPRHAQRQTRAIDEIGRATRGEIALGLGALGLVAVFGLLEPV